MTKAWLGRPCTCSAASKKVLRLPGPKEHGDPRKPDIDADASLMTTSKTPRLNLKYIRSQQDRYRKHRPKPMKVGVGRVWRAPNGKIWVPNRAKELKNAEDINFKEIDISDFEIKTRLKGVGPPDLTVSDEEPLSLTLQIPKVEFELKLGGDFGKIREGDTSGIQLSLVTDAMRSTFIEPMALLMQGITGMLTNSIVAWDGVTLPGSYNHGH